MTFEKKQEDITSPGPNLPSRSKLWHWDHRFTINDVSKITFSRVLTCDRVHLLRLVGTRRVWQAVNA